MKAKYLVIIGLLAATFAACSRDEESLFEKPAAIRAQESRGFGPRPYAESGGGKPGKIRLCILPEKVCIGRRSDAGKR